MDDFMKLVQELRKEQKAYFSEHRNYTEKQKHLVNSKALEKRVDDAIDVVDNPRLFSDD